MTTRIEWTESTWNPVTGCTKVSPGCRHCYAERMAHRLAGMSRAKRTKGEDPGKLAYYEQVEEWDKAVVVPEALEDPHHWRKPRMVFVNSMSDLFHEDVPFWFIRRVWMTMAQADRHVFQILTKRPKRMLDFVAHEWPAYVRQERDLGVHGFPSRIRKKMHEVLPNVWMGVSAENQLQFMSRYSHLAQASAAVRFVSFEPLLESIAMGGATPDWAIVGGESGPGARPMDPDWARSLRDQCQDSSVPFFFKQGSAANWDNYKDFGSFPADLQIREYPERRQRAGLPLLGDTR